MFKVACFLAVTTAWLLAEAQAKDDDFDPQLATKAVARMLQKYPVERPPLDDAGVERWLNAFLAHLDPRSLYFNKADVDEFQQRCRELSQTIREGDPRLPHEVRQRYQQRVAEAVGYAKEYLDARHDYTIDEACPLPFASYAHTPSDCRERWRLQIKLELLIEKANGVSQEQAAAELLTRYEKIARQAAALNEEQLYKVYLTSLLSLYDPEAAWYSPTEADSFEGSRLSRGYGMPVYLKSHRGQYVVRQIWHVHQTDEELARIQGWVALGVRRLNGQFLPVVEIYPQDVYHLLRSHYGPLADDSAVLLEVMHPLTLERRTVPCPRAIRR